MPTMFSKNCILEGYVDSYCIVCSTRLCEEKDVMAHIQTPTHTANLKAVAYYEKFKDDFIIKVKAVYFCELCNQTFTTTAAVAIHVAEETHVTRRKTQMMRVGTSIVSQKTTMIEERAWNGIVGDTCVACNADFDDYLTHVSEETHIFNVIRSIVTIDNDNNTYRKVEDGYHCLTCNILISDDSLTEHLTSTDHNSAIVKGDLSQYTGSDEIKAGGSVEKKTEKEVKSDEIVKDTGMRLSETCDFVGPSTSSGPLLTKDKQTPPKSICNEVAIFAKKHILEGKNTMSLTKFTKSQHDKKNIETMKASEFITRVKRVANLDGKFVIINEKFLLKIDDFLGIEMFRSVFVCHFCQMEVSRIHLETHKKSEKHARLLNKSNVLISLEKEFIRQLTSDFYQCGYCGTLNSNYDDLLNHLTTKGHMKLRAKSESMLKHFEYDNWIEYDI